jgi:hypothetical protein
MAPGRDCHGAFVAGTNYGKIVERYSRGDRQRSRCAEEAGSGAIALLGGRQWMVVASSVPVYETGRMVLNMSKLPQLGWLGKHC